MPSPTSSLLLFGGGVDSVCLGAFLHEHGTSFDLLFIDYRQKAVVGEFEAAVFFAEEFDAKLHCIRSDAYRNIKNPILNGEMAKEHSHNVLPIRNQLFLTLATIFAGENGYNKIYLGFHQEPFDSKFYDATPAFVDSYQQLLNIQEVRVEIKTPFAFLPQRDYLQYATKSQLSKSFSCYESKTETECGQCTHCTRKRELFKSLDVD